MNRNSFNRYSGAGSPTSDMGFTVQNGAVVRSPMSGYLAAQGGTVTLTREAESENPTLTIPITNYGVGPFQYSNMGLTNFTGSVILTPANIQLSSVPTAIAANETKNIIITYIGPDIAASAFSITFNGSKNNTRLPFLINNIRIEILTIGV